MIECELLSSSGIVDNKSLRTMSFPIILRYKALKIVVVGGSVLDLKI